MILNAGMPRKTVLVPSLLYCLVVLPAVLPATVAYAGEGIFLMGNDAIQLGRASSGVASPRTSYWSYMNPASMVDLDRRIDVNLYNIYDSFKLKPRGVLGNRLDGDLVSEKIVPYLVHRRDPALEERHAWGRHFCSQRVWRGISSFPQHHQPAL